ncbi:MAG: thiol:disulfide interchange protein DsbA/DsbL [Burkholderiaceae bacterium]|jgi:thiol:disulfide interchange protein DsbA|nr:thiol:disulfide interchange protein DsbA/DsbL [Burkholderiaceae bacterium]
MKRREFTLTTASAALAVFSHGPARAQDEPFKAGADYLVLQKPVPVDAAPPQIEIIEFFSYGCSHCRDFEPMLEKWMKAAPKDVSARREHVSFQRNFEPLQRIYYTLEIMGKVEQLHDKVYAAVQAERKRLDQPQVLFPWIAGQGADRAKFEEIYNSFGVATRVRRATELQNAYAVEGTPAMTTAGRYYTDGGMAKGFERMLAMTDMLIERERKRMRG